MRALGRDDGGEAIVRERSGANAPKTTMRAALQDRVVAAIIVFLTISINSNPGPELYPGSALRGMTMLLTGL